MNKNSGISLIVLIITIVVGFVLLAVSALKINDAIKNSNTSRFVNEIVTIKDSAISYYTLNNQLPISDTNTQEYTQSEFINLMDAAYKETLIQELKLNDDYSNDVTNESVFYELSAEDVEISKSSRGNKNDGEKDVYYFAYPSMNIYYMKGVKIGDSTYFSYTSRIVNINDINT